MGEYSVINKNSRIAGQVTSSDTPEGRLFKLQIEPGQAKQYRIAQMDDYSRLPRGKFLYRPPVTLSLQARVSAEDLPGTWGFGFWNDPFALGIGIKGSGFRLPALPETAWFFYGSKRNDLSVSSTGPAYGLMASVFSSAVVPPVLLPIGIPMLPFLPIKSAARRIRRFASTFIHDKYTRLEINTSEWHNYRLEWKPDTVIFQVDGRIVCTSSISPREPLGLVIWIDNQYAAFSADGSIHFGTEENQSLAWMEIRNPVISTPD